MADLNVWTGVGRLTRDAELRYTAGGMAILSMSIAINRRVKNGEQWVDEASFFDVEMFGKRGESIKQYLTKGKQVGITGELVQDRWEKDGQTRSKLKIIASDVQLLGGQPERQGNGFQQAPKSQTAPQAPIYDGDFQDSIPF